MEEKDKDLSTLIANLDEKEVIRAVNEEINKGSGTDALVRKLQAGMVWCSPLVPGLPAMQC